MRPPMLVHRKYLVSVTAILKVPPPGHSDGKCIVSILVDPETWLWLEKTCVCDHTGYGPDIKLVYGAGERSPVMLRQCLYEGSDNGGKYGEGLIFVRLSAEKLFVTEGFVTDRFLPKLVMWGHKDRGQRWTR
jgi:hypothetical protein